MTANYPELLRTEETWRVSSATVRRSIIRLTKKKFGSSLLGMPNYQLKR